MSSPPTLDDRTLDKLSLVVFSGTYERVHYALVMASGAAASNTSTTLFFTMGAAKALLKDQGWQSLPTENGCSAKALDDEFKAKGVAGFEELLEACFALGVTIMVCEMGLRALGLEAKNLRQDLPLTPGGVVTFLSDASKDGGMLFL